MRVLTAPLSTYRVQLTPERGFDHLARLAPHLARLGVSHAYLSPILQAAPGSEHGYDVVEHSRVSSDLGGEDGLRAAARALRTHGIGVVVDVVPNHMAVPTPAYLNRPLWSVLREGPRSAHASWFDVDWGPERAIVMPILARRIAACLDAGEIVLDPSGGPDGEPVVRYFEHVVPVRPGTADLRIEELLDRQFYRLAYWKAAHEELNYRRFFDVDTLIGVRVEDPDVFAATHEVVLRLLREGVIQGLRIDHPDGLADPGAYLRRLHDETGGAWVVAEKILEREEDMPTDWPCAGTTGYDALVRITGVLVDPSGLGLLTSAFRDATGAGEWEAVREQARRDVLATMLVAEVDHLASLAHAFAQHHLRLRDLSRRGLHEAVVELLVAIRVYRAYVAPGVPAAPAAVDVVEQAMLRAIAALPAREEEICFVADLALARHGSGPEQDEFCLRFQQTTGPAVAKSDEDTAFYRWLPLAALAEVGGSPSHSAVDPHEFVEWAARRGDAYPSTMNSLSTHDTKRTEDVRARVALLSEIAGEYVATVASWRAQPGLNAGADDLSVDPVLEWTLWQTLVGAWPITADRLGAYLLKAAREAKQSTSWAAPDEAYEQRVLSLVERVLGDDELMAGIAAFVDRLHPGFVANVLAQRLLQLVIPGVPDVYQGCEVVALTLVDPDNRQPVDLDVRAADLERGLSAVPDSAADLDAAKSRLVAVGLGLRRDRPDLLGPGVPLSAVPVLGDAAQHAIGVRRGRDVVALTTRWPLRLASAGGWRGATVEPSRGRWVDVLTEQQHDLPDGPVEVESLLSSWPVALLVRER
ncbi:MAG: malto-oligosyltrehalose synthase [Candidatus Nanopelagicales bacterium]